MRRAMAEPVGSLWLPRTANPSLVLQPPCFLTNVTTGVAAGFLNQSPMISLVGRKAIIKKMLGFKSTFIVYFLNGKI